MVGSPGDVPQGTTLAVSVHTGHGVADALSAGELDLAAEEQMVAVVDSPPSCRCPACGGHACLRAGATGLGWASNSRAHRFWNPHQRSLRPPRAAGS
jgi:hypothetical protein